MKMQDKVLCYVRTCWDSYRCSDKDEVKRIIKEVIDENPDITNISKLGMLSKRRCQNELTK